MVTLWLYTGFIGLLAIERLYELALSKRNAARAFAQGAIEVGAAHYRVMTAFHTAFLVACVAEPWLRRGGFSPALAAVTLAVALFAQGLRYWAISTLGDRWNTRVIVLPSSAPVTGGPYRFIKHPNYVAVVLELLAVPLIAGSWITALVFSLGNAALLAVRIQAEERALGEGWQRAFEGKHRFIPGGKGG